MPRTRPGVGPFVDEPSSPGRRPMPLRRSSAAPITPKSRGSSDEPRRAAAGAGAGCEPFAPELEDRDGPVRAVVADRRAASDRATATVAAVAAIRVSSSSRSAIGVLAAAPIVAFRRRRRRSRDRGATSRAARSPRPRAAALEPRPAVAAPRRSGVGGALGQAALGRGEEALEVAQPVAAVAAGVDPVVAEPAGVGPCPDRVRVHAQEPRGLGDRQGRVDRTGGMSGWQLRLVEEMSSRRAGAYQVSQFLPIGRKSLGAPSAIAVGLAASGRSSGQRLRRAFALRRSSANVVGQADPDRRHDDRHDRDDGHARGSRARARRRGRAPRRCSEGRHRRPA